MGAIGASSFAFRDFLKYILPTVIALCLFVPMFVPGSQLEVDKLIFVGIVMGYIVYSPISMISNFIQRKLIRWEQLSLSKKSSVVMVREWWSGNWDYNALWSILDKDEREYLYLTLSYIELYQITGIYFLIYSLVNYVYLIYYWLRQVAPPTQIKEVVDQIFSIQTMMFVNWRMPTLLVIGFALILTYFLLNNSIIMYGALFGEYGSYVSFAKRYHKEKGGIALSVWGTVYQVVENKKRGIPNVQVRIYKDNKLIDGEKLVSTNAKGYFQFKDLFAICINSYCKVIITSDEWQGEGIFKFDEKTIPFISIEAKAKD